MLRQRQPLVSRSLPRGPGERGAYKRIDRTTATTQRTPEQDRPTSDPSRGIGRRTICFTVSFLASPAYSIVFFLPGVLFHFRVPWPSRFPHLGRTVALCATRLGFRRNRYTSKRILVLDAIRTCVIWSAEFISQFVAGYALHIFGCRGAAIGPGGPGRLRCT